MREVEFRDGKKLVPDHLADLMVPFETHTMTIDQAKDKVNDKLLSDKLSKVQSDVVREHLTRFGMGE